MQKKRYRKKKKRKCIQKTDNMNDMNLSFSPFMHSII